LPILDPEGAPLIGVIESATDSLFVVSRTDARILESTDAGGTWRQLNSPGERALVTSLLAVPSGSLFAGSTTTISRKRGDEPWRTVPYYWSSTVPVADSIWGLSYRSGPLFVAAGGEGGIQPRAHEGSIIALDTALVTSGTGWALGGNSQWDYSYHGRDYRCVLAKADGSALAGSQGMIVSGARGASQSSQVYSTQGTISALLEDSRGNIWATNDGSGVFVAFRWDKRRRRIPFDRQRRYLGGFRSFREDRAGPGDGAGEQSLRRAQ
jgi:hypothetical protein